MSVQDVIDLLKREHPKKLSTSEVVEKLRPLSPDTVKSNLTTARRWPEVEMVKSNGSRQSFWGYHERKEVQLGKKRIRRGV